MFSSSLRRLSILAVLFLVFLVTYLRVSLSSLLACLPIREEFASSDATTAANVTTAVSNRRTRTFVRYESSLWERQWLNRIDSLNDLVKNDTLCNFMESRFIKKFMLALCTSSHKSWCIVNDTYRPIYVDIDTGTARQTPPKGIIFPDPKPIKTLDLNRQLFSRFVYLDEQGQEYFEYIEPLVGYLRHPLCCCEHKYTYGASFRPIRYPRKGCYGWLRTTRTHIVPPHPSGGFDKYWYFDAGASDWSSGLGGPSLSYFTEIWQRQGIEFDGIYAWEGTTNMSAFYETVPIEHRPRVHYDQTFVRSKLHDLHNPNGPFIPQIIQQVAKPEDYVLFKLDIDSPGVEEGNIEFLLDPVNDILDYVDEFFYEFHSDDLPFWYRNFLALRKAGVRAHSWI